jgi:hypothetical protein
MPQIFNRLHKGKFKINNVTCRILERHISVNIATKFQTPQLRNMDSDSGKEMYFFFCVASGSTVGPI